MYVALSRLSSLYMGDTFQCC